MIRSGPPGSRVASEAVSCEPSVSVTRTCFFWEAGKLVKSELKAMPLTRAISICSGFPPATA